MWLYSGISNDFRISKSAGWKQSELPLILMDSIYSWEPFSEPVSPDSPPGAF
jgi:hypothetical protein